MNQNNNSLEKVVKELARIREDHFGGMTSYEGEVLDAALALLKAKEPKLVKNIHKQYNNVLNPNAPWVGKCPKCGKKIDGRNLTRFCKYCGQAVKWE